MPEESLFLLSLPSSSSCSDDIRFNPVNVEKTSLISPSAGKERRKILTWSSWVLLPCMHPAADLKFAIKFCSIDRSTESPFQYPGVRRTTWLPDIKFLWSSGWDVGRFSSCFKWILHPCLDQHCFKKMHWRVPSSNHFLIKCWFSKWANMWVLISSEIYCTFHVKDGSICNRNLCMYFLEKFAYIKCL